MPIYIAIADDSPLIRFILKNRIQELPAIHVITEASDGQDLLKKLDQMQVLPDICILDIKMPVMDGFETLKVLNQKYPKIRNLILSQYCHKDAVARMIAVGARGIISKETKLLNLEEPILALVDRGYYYNEIADEALFEKIKNNYPLPKSITKSEQIILKLFCDGVSVDEIAVQLSLSRHTIRKHLSNLMAKFEVPSLELLIIYAIKNEIAF